MSSWLSYGLLAAVFWGSYVVAGKLAVSEKYFGVKPAFFLLLMLSGIAAVFIAYAVRGGSVALPRNPWGMGMALLSGILWGGGMVSSLKAITAGADVAKLAPIYNTNTLVAVALGMLLLHELPKGGAETVRLIVGAAMIVVGATLVGF